MWLVDVYNYDKEIKLIFIFWFDIVMQFFYIKKRPVFNYIMIYLDSPQEQMQGTDSRKSNQYSIRHYN